MIYLKEGNVPLNLAFDDDIIQEANSTYQLSFKFPVIDNKWELLTKETFLLADDLHGEQEFIIIETKKKHGYIQIYANQVATLLNYYSIDTISVSRVAGQTVMSNLAGSIKRANHPFSFFSDIMERHTFNMSDVSVMDALTKDKHSIVGQWGGDLVRDKYQIKLLKNGGSENESLFMYKKNLSGYEESGNIKSLRTRIHFKKVIKATTEDEEDKVFAVTVDSPLINQYSQIYESNVEVTDQDVTDQESLAEYGRQYFSRTLCDVIEDSITLDVKGQSDVPVKIFDVVSVYHERFSMDMRLKISKYHFAPMTKRLKSIGFGKVNQSFGGAINNAINSAVNNLNDKILDNIELKLQAEIENANRHFDAEFDKRVEAINDDIEKAKADAEVYADTIRQDISQEFDTFEQEYQANKTAHDRQISDIRAQATDAKMLAQQAQQIGTQAKIDAIAEANRLLTVERQTVEGKLATVKTQAVAEANRLIETAKSLLAGQVSSVSTDLNQTKEAIKLLATRATVDALTGRVSSAESTLQVQAGEIASRVKASDFDQAKQRLSAAESSITQLGNRITTEIAETKGVIPTGSGTRNLLKGTKDLSGNVYSQYNTSEKYLDFNVASTRVTTKHLDAFYGTTTIPLTATEYIVTFFAKSDVDGATLYCHFYNPNTTTKVESSTGYKGSSSDGLARVQVTTEWQRYWVKWTQTVSTPASLKRVIVGRNNSVDGVKTIEVAGVALYEGNLPRDWSPAPEDVTSEIENTKTLITQTAKGQEQLTTRLSQTEDKVTTAETNIRQLLNDVSSKVSQRDFDTATGRLTNAETQITQNATEISRRMTRLDVERAIRDKNYVKFSEVKTVVDESAEKFERQIIETKGLIPTSVGARNYIRNYGSAFFPANSHTSGWRFELIDDATARSGKVVKATCTTAGGAGFHRAVFDLRGAEYQDRVMTYAVDVKASRAVTVNIKPEAFEGGANNVSVTTSWQRVTLTRAVKFVTYWSFVFYIASGSWSVGDILYIRDPQLEDGKLASTPGTALEDLVTEARYHTLQDTVDQHKRLIGDGSSISQAIQSASKFERSIASGGDIYQAIETAKGLVQEVTGANGLKTQMTHLAGSWAIKNLTSAGTVLNQINVLANGTNRIDGRLTHITGQTLIDNAVIKSAMVDKLKTANFESGSVTTAILAANSVNADKLVVDQAFFNKLMANEAYLKQLFAKSAFINQVQAVTLSANQISGGVIKAINNAMQINLNNANITFNNDATIDFNSANNALVRRKGTHTAFVHFNDVLSATDGGVGSLYASIGVTSSGDGINSSSSGRFAGLRVFRAARETNHIATIDQAELYGDNIILKDDFTIGRGFKFDPTKTDKMVDMNYLVGAVRALARCWIHMNNVKWNPQDAALGRAIINEYNGHMKDL
ncbi:phage tail spike protein [Streptococcus sp. S784/96/1]|uniref:phage tail spike protein n=1 Tax=Streptococcus sp. S784/96/1 TaxID=2653499 RepID=UPI001389869F|nr:phage tail spike protein [Streptococcus sp. S784/96/1]